MESRPSTRESRSASCGGAPATPNACWKRARAEAEPSSVVVAPCSTSAMEAICASGGVDAREQNAWHWNAWRPPSKRPDPRDRTWATDERPPYRRLLLAADDDTDCVCRIAGLMAPLGWWWYWCWGCWCGGGGGASACRCRSSASASSSRRVRSSTSLLLGGGGDAAAASCKRCVCAAAACCNTCGRTSATSVAVARRRHGLRGRGTHRRRSPAPVGAAARPVRLPTPGSRARPGWRRRCSARPGHLRGAIDGRGSRQARVMSAPWLRFTHHACGRCGGVPRAPTSEAAELVGERQGHVVRRAAHAAVSVKRCHQHDLPGRRTRTPPTYTCEHELEERGGRGTGRKVLEPAAVLRAPGRCRSPCPRRRLVRPPAPALPPASQRRESAGPRRR